LNKTQYNSQKTKTRLRINPQSTQGTRNSLVLKHNIRDWNLQTGYKKTSAGSDYILKETPDKTQDKNTIVTVGVYGSDSDARNGTRSSLHRRQSVGKTS
jgi:hypothetical protein